MLRLLDELLQVQCRQSCERIGFAVSAVVPNALWGGMNAWIADLGQNHGLTLLRRLDGHGRLTEKALSPSGVWWIVRGYAEQLGFSGVWPHDLRRTLARAALRGGAGMDDIRAALGHSSVAVTQRYCGQDINLENPACEKLGFWEVNEEGELTWFTNAASSGTWTPR